MKKNFTLLTVALITFSAGAATYKSIIVNKKDGTTVAINIKDELKITCDTAMLFVKGGTYDFEFPFADITGWRHDPNEQVEVDPKPVEPEPPVVGIKSVDGDRIDVAQLGDHIRITGLPAGSVISFYSIDGKMVYNNTSAADTQLIPLNNLKPGLYILSVNRQTTKILVR